MSVKKSIPPLWLSLFLALYVQSAWPELPPSVRAIELAAPRDFGYVMGEPIHHEITVKIAHPFALEADFLPQPGSAVNDWLEIRQSRWTREDQGSERIYRISLTYQVFKGVRETETVTVPVLPLRFSNGNDSTEIEVPAWNFTLTPLISPKIPDENVTLRGDLPPVENTEHPGWLAGFSVAVIGLLVYALWRLGLPPFRAARAAPFARARQALKRLRRQPPTLDTCGTAFRLVHQAINETAGHPVFSKHLDRFLHERREFEGLREQLEAFFATSQRLFFETIGAETRPGDTLDWLDTLCQQAQRIEKGLR